MPNNPIKDACGRTIPVWPGKTVFHSTDKEGAEDIAKNGYKIIPSGGYYGYAVSFTDDLEYSRNFGRHTTIAVLSNDIKILNVTLPEDGEMFGQLTKNGKVGIDRFHEVILAAGYDGLYDPGAGDLFLYNPVKARFARTAYWGGQKESRALLGGAA